MQYVKKYFTEGLIQFTILLSLIGVRVDLDTYLTGYFPPLLEADVGPSSAYIQSPLHSPRDPWEGRALHPKCPDLERCLASRRLLREVRALATPRFRTELSAWLVHSVRDDSCAVHDPPSPGAANQDEEEDGGGGGGRAEESSAVHSPRSSQDENHPSDQEEQPRPSPASSELTKEDIELIDVLWRQDVEQGGEREGVEGRAVPKAASLAAKEEENPDTEEHQDPAQERLTRSSELDSESFSDTVSLSPLRAPSVDPQPFLGGDIERHWRDFLSLSELDMEMNPERVLDIGLDISSAISQNVSLHDAMVAGSSRNVRSNSRGAPSESRQTLSRLESTNSTHSDLLLGVINLNAEFFPLVENGTRNTTTQNSMSGFLDEAVFEQINLMGFGMEGMDTIDTQILEEPDSDSGLSLDSSSRSPNSPSSSEISSSMSYCEDEGAVGYSSDSESISWDAAAGASTSTKMCRSQYRQWPPVQLADSVYHDHTYNLSPEEVEPSSPVQHGHLKSIKKEYCEEDELSRDERRARAFDIPFSVQDIVNMPVEEFLELLSSYDLTEAQVTLIRDIRRRGKNKVAAQNCRKRKLDVITNLESDVDELQRRKEKLLKERVQQNKSIGSMKQKLNQLYRDVFSRLRDEQGRPVNPSQYSLQCNSDGTVLVVPHRLMSRQQKADKRKKDKKH
ncbi:nuclear factor erythroid 2-related factor 3 [Amia ocellicauda]|uniref:nuclear factor erythroid 2-related factor 3 n=1 Tax=Amia ocellicauda TaxID=2972642 RepID=UPI00346467F6